MSIENFKSKIPKEPELLTMEALIGELLQDSHILIAGTTGSGKSTIIKELIKRAEGDLVINDPKICELSDFENSATLYGTSLKQIRNNTQITARVMFNRFSELKSGKKEFTPVWYFLDEAIIITPAHEPNAVDKKIKKDIEADLIKLATLGRAVNIHIVIATQRSTNDTINPIIKAQLTTRVGLRTATAQESRNIIEEGGLERLPLYGGGFLRSPRYTDLIPLILI